MKGIEIPEEVLDKLMENQPEFDRKNELDLTKAKRPGEKDDSQK